MRIAASAAWVGVMLTAVPAAGQSSLSGSTQAQPAPQNVTPTYPYNYPPPWLIREALKPKDTRTPRQRCVDEETAKLDGDVTDLARASISLKCSQR